MYELFLDKFDSPWHIELETRFQQIDTFITRDYHLILRITKHPFFKTVDFSLIGICCVFFQLRKKGKLDVSPYSSGVFITKE